MIWNKFVTTLHYHHITETYIFQFVRETKWRLDDDFLTLPLSEEDHRSELAIYNTQQTQTCMAYANDTLLTRRVGALNEVVTQMQTSASQLTAQINLNTCITTLQMQP